MPDEPSTPAKTTKEEIKDQSPQVIVATAIAGISQMLPNKEQGKILAILAPVISLLIVSGVSFLGKSFLNDKPEPAVNDADKPLDILLRGYIKENKRDARWLLPFGAERRQLNEARAQLRQRLHDYQMGKLVVKVDIVAADSSQHNEQQVLPSSQQPSLPPPK